MSDDLADLLGEGTSSTKDIRNKSPNRGFLGAIQRNKTMGADNRNLTSTINSNDESDDTKSQKKAIEIDDGLDTFNKDKFRNNISEEKDKLYSRSGGNFYTGSGTDVTSRRNQTGSNFYSSNIEQKNDENHNASSLMNRRRSNFNVTTNSYGMGSSKANEENLDSNKQNEIRFSRRNTSLPADHHMDDETTNVYVPTLTKNSRRARVGGNQAQSQNTESNSRSISQEKKDEQKPSSREKKNDTFEPPITFFNSAKNSSTTGNLNSINTDTNKSYNDNIVSPDFSRTVPTNDNKQVSKFFSKQDTSVSFRGQDEFTENTNYDNNNTGKDYTFYGKEKIEDNRNTVQDLRNSTDKDQKQKIDDDKRRYIMLLDEEKEKSKRKEGELTKFIEELKQRYRDELNSSEEKNKTIINSLMEDNKKLRGEIDREIQKEKERMIMIHKSELDNQENIHRRNLEQQKKFFEEQNETLKKQLQQQIEFNKLANKVELSSKQIDEILQKFYKEKEDTLINEKGSIESREKYLNDLEEKLREREKMLDQERDNIMKMRKDNELRELEKKKELQEEKVRIEKEILRLQELQNSFKILEFNAKEKYEREKLELTQKHSEMKIELDTLKSDFHQRLNDLEYSKKIFEEEKKFFEKFKDEAIKNIELKKVNLEDRKKQFYEEEREIRGRVKVLQEKEFYLKEKFEEFERVKIEVEEMEKKSEKDKRELMIAAKRIEESINSLDERSRLFEKEKDEVLKKFQEIESERAIINAEKIKIEQSKTELRLRLQNIDMLRIKYVSSNIGMPVPLSNDFQTDFRSAQRENPFQQNPNSSMSNFQKNTSNMNLTNNYLNQKISNIQNNLNNLTDLKNSKALSNSSNLRKSFNADDYMQSLRLKLGEKDYTIGNNNNTNNFIQHEREYLKKSMDNYENSIKMDYEKLSQQYLNNLNIDKFNPSSSVYLKEINYSKERNDIADYEIVYKDDNKLIQNNDKFLIKEDKSISNNMSRGNIKSISNEKKSPEKKKDIFDDFDEITQNY